MNLALLLVEDDVVDRAAVRRALKAAAIGGTVSEVETVDAALELLQSSRFDCVLLDYQLPRGDGLELLAQARTRGMRTPIVALTGHGDEQLAAEMMRAGAADYLSKQTLTPDRLARSLRHAIALAQAEEERLLLLAREQEARAEAQTANRAKDEFLAMLSHELRTPLNAILGWSSLLAGGTLDSAKTVRAIQTIERNARAQSRLIEDLLDISRVAAGKIQLELAVVDLGALVESAVESFRPHAAAKGVALSYEQACHACQVMGDASRLHQIASNLISNAVKFTPAGGSVTIVLESLPYGAVLTVSDTGIGLEPEFLPYAFERFRQAEDGFVRQQGGLGLGLAIVRHLVQLHGGEVAAASAGVGHGAMFTVTLPAMLEAPAGDQEEHAAGGPPLSLAGVHVLAVDDNAESLALIDAVLSGLGARVTTASSAGQALAEMARDLPDVLVSDIGMPETDGLELIHAVRASAIPALRRLPAAAITAYAAASDRDRAIGAGFHAHLAKPIEPDELAALVARLAGVATAGLE